MSNTYLEYSKQSGKSVCELFNQLWPCCVVGALESGIWITYHHSENVDTHPNEFPFLPPPPLPNEFPFLTPPLPVSITLKVNNWLAPEEKSLTFQLPLQTIKASHNGVQNWSYPCGFSVFEPLTTTLISSLSWSIHWIKYLKIRFQWRIPCPICPWYLPNRWLLSQPGPLVCEHRMSPVSPSTQNSLCPQLTRKWHLQGKKINKMTKVLFSQKYLQIQICITYLG